MFRKINRWVCLILILLLSAPVFSQQTATQISDTLGNEGNIYLSIYDDENLMQITLPSLEELTDGAIANSPNRKSLLMLIETRKREAKTANREWLKFLGASASFGTGNTAMLSSASTESYAPPGWLYSSNQQTYYSMGVSVNLPLQTLVDWKNRSKMRVAGIKQAEYDELQFEQNLKREIITLYNEAVLSLSLLKGKTQAVELASAYMTEVEANFAIGKVNTSTLTQTKQDQMRLQSEFEDIKNSLRISLSMLELLSGIKIYKPGK
jgi:outer membrane protein TolC